MHWPIDSQDAALYRFICTSRNSTRSSPEQRIGKSTIKHPQQRVSTIVGGVMTGFLRCCSGLDPGEILLVQIGRDSNAQTLRHVSKHANGLMCLL